MMSEKTIYDTLRSYGMTAEGACGLMGNMMAESSMKANIAQRGMTKLTDDQYTAAADNGLIDFRNDQVGYGLCQWTYPTRKQALLTFAKSQGCSVGDEGMQTRFCIHELQLDYPGVWRVLTESHDLYEATRIVCIQYERPAVNNVDARYRFALDFFGRLGGTSAEPEGETEGTAPADPAPEGELTVMILQILMHKDGYWDGPIDGIRTPEWREAFLRWAADVGRC